MCVCYDGNGSEREQAWFKNVGDGQNILGIIIAILFINTSVAGLVDLAIKDGEGNRIKAFERKQVVKISAVFRLFRQRKDNNKKDVDVFLVFFLSNGLCVVCYCANALESYLFASRSAAALEEEVIWNMCCSHKYIEAALINSQKIKIKEENFLKRVGSVFMFYVLPSDKTMKTHNQGRFYVIRNRIKSTVNDTFKHPFCRFSCSSRRKLPLCFYNVLW